MSATTKLRLKREAMLLRAVADLIESGDVLADLVRNARSDVSDEARAALDDWEVKSNAFD